VRKKTNNWSDKSLVEIRVDLDSGSYSSEELVKNYLSLIDKLEDKIGALLYFDKEQVLKEARAADKKIAAGEKRELLGIPILIKDNMHVAGMSTTAGSRMLKDYQPVYEATVVKKLKASGAIILGKANMDEFAMGSSCENSYYKITHNPWDLSKVPGGSSGGSAAGVAAGYCPAALGSDTGGSIRQPASLCGLVGMKPTYGRVSRYGVIALASSFDQIGPFARRVEDAALVLKIIAGQDSKDSTASHLSVGEYDNLVKSTVNGRKAAIVKELYEGVGDELRVVFDHAIADIRDLGVVVEEVSIPIIKYSIPVYYILQPSECSTNLARFDGVRYGYNAQIDQDVYDEAEDLYEQTRSRGFGMEVKRRIMLGTYSLSSGYYDDYFGKAARVRTLIISEFKKCLAEYDYLLGFTSPLTAFGVGEKIDDPLSMYLTDVMTVSMNLSGVPAISVPIGFSDGLPVGMQMVGNWFAEADLFKLAYNYQNINNWYLKKPKILKDLI